MNKVHAYLDNKHFPVFLDRRGRDYAAKRVAKGTYRGRGGGLGEGHVRPKKNFKMNFGAKTLQVSCAISSEKVLMWHVVEGTWGAEAAVHMYRDKLAPALDKAYGRVRGLQLLEAGVVVVVAVVVVVVVVGCSANILDSRAERNDAGSPARCCNYYVLRTA